MSSRELVIEGAPSPQPPVTALPSALSELLATHGEGLLAGLIDLVSPGSEAHAEVRARFMAAVEARKAHVAWLLLGAAGVEAFEVVGEARRERGFLLCRREGAGDPAERLWFCHRAGGMYPFGADLDACVERLVSGSLFAIEHGTSPLDVHSDRWSALEDPADSLLASCCPLRRWLKTGRSCCCCSMCSITAGTWCTSRTRCCS